MNETTKKANLQLQVVEARRISVPGDKVAISDVSPYIVVTLSTSSHSSTLSSPAPQRFKTKPIKKTLNPVWNQVFLVNEVSEGNTLQFELYHSALLSDRILAISTYQIGDITSSKEEWIPMQRVSENKSSSAVIVPCGELLIRLAFSQINILSSNSPGLSNRGASPSDTVSQSPLFTIQKLFNRRISADSNTPTSSTTPIPPSPSISSQQQQSASPGLTRSRSGSTPQHTLPQPILPSREKSEVIHSPNPNIPTTPSTNSQQQQQSNNPILPSFASFRRRRKERDTHRRTGKEAGHFDHGLIDCFFVIGCGDMITDLEEQIAKQIAEKRPINPNPCEIIFSGELIDSFPWLDWEALPPSIWTFCLPEGIKLTRNKKLEPSIFPFVMTAARGNRKFVTCLTVQEEVEKEVISELFKKVKTFPLNNLTEKIEKSIPLETDKIYAPKCYCLLSAIPCYTFCREWLKVFYDNAFRSSSAFCIEACIAHLIKGVPMPIPMGIPMKITFAGVEFTELIPPSPEIPFLDLPFKLLFDSLSLKNIITVFSSLLLEEKVLLVSKNRTLITFSCEIFSALLWPLKWPHVFVPILPKQLLDVVDSPTPFLIGIQNSYINCLKESTFNQTLCVDLDNNTIKMPAESHIPELPISELLEELENIGLQERDKTDSVNWNPWNNAANNLPASIYNAKIRAAFFRCMLFLLEGYRKCILYLRAFSNTIIVFNKRKFIQTRNQNRLANTKEELPAVKENRNKFFNIFLDTQAFTSFIESHKRPSVNIVDGVFKHHNSWKNSTSSSLFLDNIFMAPQKSEFYSISLKSTIPSEIEAPTRSQVLIPINYDLIATIKPDRPHRHKIKIPSSSSSSPSKPSSSLLESLHSSPTNPSVIVQASNSLKGKINRVATQMDLPRRSLGSKKSTSNLNQTTSAYTPTPITSTTNSNSLALLPTPTVSTSAEEPTPILSTALTPERNSDTLSRLRFMSLSAADMPAIMISPITAAVNSGPKTPKGLTTTTTTATTTLNQTPTNKNAVENSNTSHSKFDRSSSDLSAASLMGILNRSAEDIPPINSSPTPTPRTNSEFINLDTNFISAVKVFVSSIVNGDKLTELLESQVVQVNKGIETEEGRVFLAEELMAQRENSKEVGKIICLKSHSLYLLGNVLRSALEKASIQNEIWSPQIFVETAEVYYQLSEGASLFASNLLHGLAIWEKPEFWETYFFLKCGEMIQSRYAPSLEKHFKEWVSKSQHDKDEIEQSEMEAVWKLIAAFAFKMCSLNVSPKIVKRFSLKLCNKMCLDDSHRQTIIQLVTNMSKLQQIGIADIDGDEK